MVDAIIAAKPGGPEVLVPGHLDPPTAGPGQLLVQVAAAGVNFLEVYQRQGC
jgi:NADPH2:quinone reductase